MSEIRLITIPISHYCEKARWALDYAGIPYFEERHLQLFHLLPAYRAGRRDTVPVLITQSGVLNDSTKILHWVDRQAPADKKLFPSDPKLRHEAEELEESFDEELGVAGRLWMYTYMLNESPLMMKYSKLHGAPSHETKILPVIFPVMKGLVRRTLEMKPTSREETRTAVDGIFAKVAQRLSDGRKFLVGDHFTAADLTFAALSAPVLIPEGYGVALPKLSEVPEEMASQITKWREHPTGQFAARIYREFRK